MNITMQFILGTAVTMALAFSGWVASGQASIGDRLTAVQSSEAADHQKVVDIDTTLTDIKESQLRLESKIDNLRAKF